ncbi:heme-binding domain-containing protein [Arenibacter echinorum]|uniref:Heme-binding protein n=1 Tax=Arenibacter echinorum TaxID=440515 RepID=A0A327R2J2_9FLAO|nr:heme-binding domain-containing protein [Arenibacter echinorum]RAJ10278.1 heme-binding protein [Arenibacter echinorum]
MAVCKSKLTEKVVTIIGSILLVVLVGIQFVPTKPNLSEIVPETDFMVINSVPKTIQNKLQVSCYDCHSNNTEYPWYNKIQPIAWILEDHVVQGKEELNFNEWGNYSARRKNSKLKSIISQIEDDEMPLFSYTIVHGDAKLSEEDKKEIIKYLTQVKKDL